MTKTNEKLKVAAEKGPVATAKADVPCTFVLRSHYVRYAQHTIGNVSPYSTGLPGASLTSTSVDPQISSSKLLWDEVRQVNVYTQLRH